MPAPEQEPKSVRDACDRRQEEELRREQERQRRREQEQQNK